VDTLSSRSTDVNSRSGRAPGQPRRAGNYGNYFARLAQAHPSHWQGFSQPHSGEHWQPLVFLEPQVHAAWLQLVQRQVLVVLVFMALSRFLEHLGLKLLTQLQCRHYTKKPALSDPCWMVLFATTTEEKAHFCSHVRSSNR